MFEAGHRIFRRGWVAAATITALLAAGYISSASPASGAPAKTPGVTATEIRIGYVYTTASNDPSLATVFAQSKEEFQSVLNNVNAHGGVLGHKLVMVPFGYDIASALNGSQLEQQACTLFTQDQRVFVTVIQSYTATSVLPQCLANDKIITISTGGVTFRDQQDYNKWPYFVVAGALNLSDSGQVVNKLFKEGFFTPAGKIGEVYDNVPEFATAVASDAKALKTHGLRITDSLPIPHSSTISEAQGTTAAISSAVLRFKSEDIKYVIFHGNLVAGTFIAAAAKQGYDPR